MYDLFHVLLPLRHTYRSIEGMRLFTYVFMYVLCIYVCIMYVCMYECMYV
jgi:hypothetical protein